MCGDLENEEWESAALLALCNSPAWPHALRRGIFAWAGVGSGVASYGGARVVHLRSGMERVRVLGIDPSLVACGWGVVDVRGAKVSHVAHGVVKPPTKLPLPERLHALYMEISALIAEFGPDSLGIEEAFMKNNAQSALKLGQARAACIIAATVRGLPVGEYSPRSVKQSVVGTGGADKAQVAHMMNVMMPGLGLKAGDAADALAIAVCHSQRRGSGLAKAIRDSI